MDHYQKLVSTPTQSEQSERTVGNNDSQGTSKYTEGLQSSNYTDRTQFNSDVTSDVLSSDQNTKSSFQSSQRSNQAPKESIKLMPVKVKDIVNMLQSNSAYRDKSPVMINMKENDIDQIIEQQTQRISTKFSSSPQQSMVKTLRGSPISVVKQFSEEPMMPMQLQESRLSPRSLKYSYIEEPIPQSSRRPSGQEREPPRPPLGADQAQQVYAMTDIQAYPMIGGAGFRADKSRRRKKPRARSVRKITPVRRVTRKPRKKKRSRSRSPMRSRSRSRRRQRPKRIVRLRSRSRRKSPIVIMNKPRYPKGRYPLIDPCCCNPYPMCEDNCTTMQTPMYHPNRPAMRHSRMSMTCTCNLCMDKLQFIQPGVCSKKKYMWTNEYAIIPKGQVNFIDPCEDLDPLIYPRANNPCIRDGRGNPLTDCIGRPLRDPIGKRFLNFNANGSVMDTNFRGNNYTGQPPLCVKCTLPGNSCAPDTTHNWWMSCGYPIRPDMTPYVQHVTAAENQFRRY